jgi:hypothetical protein
MQAIFSKFRTIKNNPVNTGFAAAYQLALFVQQDATADRANRGIGMLVIRLLVIMTGLVHESKIIQDANGRNRLKIIT